MEIISFEQNKNDFTNKSHKLNLTLKSCFKTSKK